MNPPCQNNIVPQYVPTPPGHYSNPLDNIVAATSRLAALPIDGESPVEIETRRARELLQTTLNQQQAYSHSRERIHSTPVRVRAIVGTLRMNRPCQAVHITVTRREGITRQVVVLLCGM